MVRVVVAGRRVVVETTVLCIKIQIIVIVVTSVVPTHIGSSRGVIVVVAAFLHDCRLYNVAVPDSQPPIPPSLFVVVLWGIAVLLYAGI